MKDREKTEIITKSGFLYLRNMGCFEIATEVKIPYWGLRDWGNRQDRHYSIDLVGVNWKYLPPSKQYIKKIKTESHEWDHKVIKEPKIRGIEIKVSRGDFKNGFIHGGCNYNYLMTPKGLVEKNEVNKDIGIIEVDLDNLLIRKLQSPYYGLHIEGIEPIRNPKHKPITEEQMSRIRGQIGYRLTLQTALWLRDEMLKSSLPNTKEKVK